MFFTPAFDRVALQETFYGTIKIKRKEELYLKKLNIVGEVNIDKRAVRK